jgi:hypothetical protein
MLLAQDIRPLPRPPQRRLAIIATVSGIHIAVLAAFLSGLAPKVTGHHTSATAGGSGCRYVRAADSAEAGRSDLPRKRLNDP